MNASKRELNRKLRLIILSFAAVGAILPFLFYGFWFTKYGSSLEERLSGLMFILCPPYLGTMAFDNMSAKDRIEAVATFAVMNAVLYSIVGLFIATARESFARRKRNSVQR